MVDTQEIIERSVYFSILTTAVSKGYSLDPSNYLPVTEESKARFDSDKSTIINSGKPFISIFGAGNNQSKGIKEVPRIVVDPQGFFPGDIGFDKQSIQKGENGYVVSESNYVESVDQIINIHLVANSIADMRLLHNVLSSSIPQRGYIKPYIYNIKPFDGNIFIILANYFSLPDLDKGIMEKVYQFNVKDTILEELFIDTGEIISPIQDISLLINKGTTIETNNQITNN